MKNNDYDYSSSLQFIGKIYDTEEFTNEEMKLIIGVYYNKDVPIFTATINKKLYCKKINKSNDNLIIFKGYCVLVNLQKI